MSKKQIKTFIITSIIWLVCLIAGITHSLLYNEGRWVVEMDLENLYFSVKDIPMLTVGVLTILWGIYVVMVAFKNHFSMFFFHRIVPIRVIQKKYRLLWEYLEYAVFWDF